MKNMLDAPCLFCGYNGQGYWQNGTHHEQCPWHMVSGSVDREMMLPKLVSDLFQLAIAAEDYIDENPCDPDITFGQAEAWGVYLEALRRVRNFGGSTK